MKTNHLDVLFMEKAARRRGYSPAQLRAALDAYEHGGFSARVLLASLGLLPKTPDPEPEMNADELEQLRSTLDQPEADPAEAPSDPVPPPAPPAVS